MARQSQDREDLLRDATALVPRVQLRLAQGEVVAGFRGEAISLYFDGDPVYHFNARGELRRAFVGGRLFKAERGRLVALAPHHGDDGTELVRHELADAETAEFRANLVAALSRLRDAIGSAQFSVLGQVPPGGDGLQRLADFLRQFEDLRIAASPRVGK